MIYTSQGTEPFGSDYCGEYEARGDALGLYNCRAIMTVAPPPSSSLKPCVQDCLNSSANDLETCERLCGEIGPVVTMPDGSVVFTVTRNEYLKGFPWLLLLLLLAWLWYESQ